MVKKIRKNNMSFKKPTSSRSKYKKKRKNKQLARITMNKNLGQPMNNKEIKIW
jgi:hypothetical protein